MAGETEYVLVTEYFHPDTASTGQLMTDLAVGLQERGLDMTVLTGQPNYHSGENPRQPTTTQYKGVEVNRIRAPLLRQTSFLRRAINWTVFTVWMSIVLLVARPERHRELIFVSTPPILPVALWAVCRVRGWDYTYIVYDLYPDFTIESGYFNEDGIVDSVWSSLNTHVFGRAKHIVALGPVMRDRIIASTGSEFDESKVAIIHNWADEQFIQPVEKDDNWFADEHGLQDSFTLLYSGNIGENHDLETVLHAAAALDDTVTVLIIGDGDRKDRTVALAEELGIRGNRVRFLPYQPHEDLPYSLTAGDVSVVAVKEGLEGICVSSKIYTALAAGMPVLVVADPEGDEATIVEACGAGVQVTQGDIDGAVDAVERWLSDPGLVDTQGENARMAFERWFTKDHSIDRYFSLLTDEAYLSPDPLTNRVRD